MLDQILQSLKIVKKERADLQQELEVLKQRRDELEHAPLSRQDVLQHLINGIDSGVAAGSESLRNYALNQIATRRPGWQPAELGGRSVIDPLEVIGNGSRGGSVQSPPLLLLLAPILKESLARIVEGWDWPEGALNLSRDERLKEIRRLDVQIDKLEVKIKKIEAEAQQAGVILR